MNILDRFGEFKKIDNTNLLKNIEDFPFQCEQAWDEIKKIALPSYYLGAKKVVLAGMGGSAIGGNLVKSLVLKESKTPLFVLRDYILPNFVDRDTLMIAVSYSGNTEEVLALVSESLAKRVKLVGISTNGELEKIARSKKFPFYKFDYPSQPRQSLGFLFTALLGILNKIAVIDLKDEEFKQNILLTKALGSKIKKDVPFSKNQAKKIALQMHKKIPIILGAGYLKPIAFRFKTQLNENAKQVAFCEELPEACHNFIAGLDYPKSLSEYIFCLSLSSKYDHSRNKARIKILEEVLTKKKIPHDTLLIEPAPSPLVEMLSFIFLLDYASFYAAILNKTDPTTISNIDYLKKRLKELL